MAITNSVGYTFINTVLRKELNGNPITIDKYNNLLNFAFEEKLSDEYTKFEVNQKSTDFFRLLKRTESINPNVSGVYDLTRLADSYWHVTGVSYINGGSHIKIDVVPDYEWNLRMASSMEQPDADYPICKVDGDTLVFNPLAMGQGVNLVTNAGFDDDTDWINPVWGLAEDWEVVTTGTRTDQVVRKYNFDGTAQGIGRASFFYYGEIRYSLLADVPNGRYSISFDYAVSDYPGDAYLRVRFNNDNVALTPTVTGLLNKTNFYTTFDFSDTSSLTNGISFYYYNSELEDDKRIYIDNVYIGVAVDVILNYIKTPSTPYMDWYYDANDRIKFLSEGQAYTLLTGERYIDKDDGTVRTAGYLITALENKTREMEIPDDDRRGVFYSILSKLGVPLNKLDATQYSMQMESKENVK